MAESKVKHALAALSVTAQHLGWEYVDGHQEVSYWAAALRWSEHEHFSIRVQRRRNALAFYVVDAHHCWAKPPDDPKNTDSIIYETRSLEEAVAAAILANVTE